MFRNRQKRGQDRPAVFMDGTGVRVCRGGRVEESIPWERICAFGQATDWADLWKDDFWLVLGVRGDGGERIVRIPCRMEGCTDLERRLLELKGVREPVGRLAGCIHPASVWFWPGERAGKAIWPDWGPARSVGTEADYKRWMAGVQGATPKTDTTGKPSPARRT